MPPATARAHGRRAVRFAQPHAQGRAQDAGAGVKFFVPIPVITANAHRRVAWQPDCRRERRARDGGRSQMTERVLPSVFVSHGAPTLALEENDTVEFLRRLGAELGRPRAILCVSAHWATRVPTLSAAAAAHFSVGCALAPLRREGVLILATGGATHNLHQLGRGEDAPAWAARFDEWLDEKIRGGSYRELLDYRGLAPHAEVAHPTDEHLLPLFVAAGAGGG